MKNTPRSTAEIAILLFSVASVIVLSNVLAERLLPVVDVSSDRLFSLSPETHSVLAGLEEPIDLIIAAGPGHEPFYGMHVLRRYQDQSSMIDLYTVDPDRDPSFYRSRLSDDTTVPLGSILVAGKRGARVIPPERFGQAVDDQTTLLTVETEVTKAIVEVGLGDENRLYVTTGHGESVGETNTTAEFLSASGLDVVQISLLSYDAIPADAALVFINGLQKDLAPKEMQILDEYLDRGGKVILFADYRRGETPNLNALLGRYRIALRPEYIEEGASRYHPGNPYYAIPAYGEHPVVAPVRSARTPIVLSFPQPIVPLGPPPSRVTIEPLLRTSDTSFLNSEGTSNDTKGPFVVAVAIEEQIDQIKRARLVVVSSGSMLKEMPEVGAVPGNYRFTAAAIDWVGTAGGAGQAPAKMVVQKYLNLQGQVMRLVSGVVLIVIPAPFFVGAIAVWLRRRNR